MASEEMVIFTRMFDFLAWLLPITHKFPRMYRYSFTQRLISTALDLNDHLETANLRRGQERLEQLKLADEALNKLRIYLRLTVRMGWLTSNQYEHVARQLSEIGNLLGGWKKTVRA